jgi:hypothetical protein
VGLERGRGRPRDSRSGDRRYKYLVVFALPLAVGALEIFNPIRLEIP